VAAVGSKLVGSNDPVNGLYQLWDVQRSIGFKPYVYQLRNRGSGKCLTTLGIPYQLGSVVQLRCNPGDMRQWWGIRDPSGITWWDADFK
jgi:hypothetical protein